MMKNLLLALLFTLVSARAADVTLEWDPNPEPDVQGYRLYYGVASGVYDQNIDVGPFTRVTATDLIPETTYYFTVTAYNAYGESGPSNEVGYTIPSAGMLARALFPTNLTPSQVTLVGIVDGITGEFGAFFEWSEGTSLLVTNTVFPAQVVHTNANQLLIEAALPIIPTNYTYRLVVTNVAARFESPVVTFATKPPQPVQIRFRVHIIQTSALGATNDWEDILVAEHSMPYPQEGTRFFQSRMSYEIDYDQDIPVPAPAPRQTGFTRASAPTPTSR